MKRAREVLRIRQLLAAALLLWDGYLVEGLGTEAERSAAASVITALLAEVSEGLQKKIGRG